MPDASRTDLERLANHLASPRGLFGEFAIRLQHHFDGFLKVSSRLFQGGALGIGPGQLFDESNVAFGNFPEHRGELKVHEAMIRATSGEA